MEVTVDPVKDAKNQAKHGISLHRAADFDVDTAFFTVDDSQDYGEIRWRAIGWLDGALHTLVFTDEEEGIHPISLRRASRSESEEYEQAY